MQCMNTPLTFRIPAGNGVFFWPPCGEPLFDPFEVMDKYADEGWDIVFRARQVSRMTIGFSSVDPDPALFDWLVRARANVAAIIIKYRWMKFVKSYIKDRWIKSYTNLRAAPMPLDVSD